MTHSLSAIVFACCFLSATAFAAELKSLDATVTETTENSYVLVRCASFYTASLEWAGTKLGEDYYDRTKEAVDSLLLVASLVRATTSHDALPDISEVVMLDARKIADLYLDYFRVSYAETGNAWEGNPVWNSDGAFCRPIAEAAIELNGELSE